MNLILIGKDVKDAALDIRDIYPECSIVEYVNSLKNNTSLISFIKNNKSILILDSSTVLSYGINNFLEFCKKYNFAISLVAENKQSDENIIYNAIEERADRVLFWYKNSNKISYENFIIYSTVWLAIDNPL